MADSLPKYMLLDQNSQQIRDRRIMPQTIYTQEGDRAIVTKKKKITNTIIMPRKVNKSSSIFNLQYSSKYGLLFLATDNEVIIKTTQQMEQDLIAEQHHNNFNLTIKFSGELFLSPDEEILAVCSQSLIQFVKVSSLAKPKNIEVPPVSNINDANHFLWIDNNNFLGWKFQGTAMLYTIDNATLTLRLQQRQLPMEEVTGASAINSRLFLVSKMLIKIFEPFTIDQPVVKAEVDMTDPGHESPYFQYSYIVDIFKININEKQFTPNDIYGLVVVYYDEQEEAVDERYITFAKGDIFNRQSLELRGYENLYSSKNSRELFYNSLDQKMSFGVKRVISSGFICLAIQRSEKIYVIDPLEDFQRINIYDIKSKHELKNEQGKFLQGVALMKNMLESQKSIPDKAQQLLVQIINKYNGQFMSLYFKDKQTSLTISFPSSILAIGGERFYRRYAISSIDGIEDENSEEILKKISLIKQSPHILPAALCKKVGQKAQQEIKKKEEKKEQQKVQIKQVKEEKKEGQGEKKEGQGEKKEGEGEKKESVGKEQAKVQLKKEEVAKQNSNKKQQVKIEEKKQEKPIQKKEQKPIQKKEQKVSPYAITEKDRSKPPMTTAELFATSNSLFSAPKPPPIIQKQKKAEEPKNAIQPQNKDQSKNPFAGMTKQNTANSFFKGNQSGNLFSNVPNLFEKKPASQPQPSFNPPTNIFSQVPTTNLFSPAQPKPSSVKSQEGVFAVSESKEVKAAEAFKLGPSSSSSVNSLFNKPVGSVIMSNVPINNEQVLPKQENKPLINLFKPSSFNDDLKPPSKSSFFPQEIRIQKQPLRQGSKSAKIPNEVKPVKPQPQQNKQSQVQQILNQSLLQSISQKVSVFRTWQKDTFSQKSKDAEPTSLPNIKQLYNRQLKILSNLRSDFFKETQQPMSEYYTKSIKKSPTFEKIQTDPSFQQNEQKLKQNLTYYEQVSDKMLYYINQLGKKNQNMRASNLAKNSYEKAANFLARITQDNQQKIIVLEKESQMKMEQLRTISNQRIKEKRKRKQKNKGKRYNFQDQTQEQYQEHPSLIFNADTTSSQTNIKPIKAVIINLDTIKEAPKIKLPEFENKSNFASQVPKKVDSQSSSKNVSKVPQPSSFAEKIPPKKQKVLVPVIENPQPKKQEQKQAISQVYSEQDVDQLEIPTAKRQISSIQTAQVKGLKLSTQFKPKQQTEVKPAQPKKNIFGGGQKKEGEDPMLFSQTTSVFNSSKNNTSMFNTTANVKPKEEEKKEGQAKMFGFNPPKKQQKTTVIQAQTNIFGPKPSASQTNPLLSIFSKGNQKKTQQKKAEEPQSNQQQKSLGEPNTNKTSVSKANGLQSAFNNLGFGQQNKIQQKGQNIQKQQINSKPNLKPSPSRTEPTTQNTAAQQNKPTATSQQQNNVSNPLPTSDPNPNPNLNPNNKPAPNFQNMGNAFMGGSFGSQPAPQFGGGNKFLNNNMQTGNNSSGFNPNTAKFAGLSNNNAPKTFTSFGGDNKIFQQQPSSNNIPFANETNIFNQSNTNSTDPQSNTSNFNNNQAFNQNQTNNSSFPNANSTNVTTNNAFNPSNNPFNKPSNNVFANSNAFANNNSFNNTTNNAFGSSNNNNNAFGSNNNAFSGFNNNNNNVFANNSNNSFNNNQGNTNMFNQNSNINAFGNNNSANTNFLANLKPPNVIPPPSSVNPALLQPRK